MSWIEIVGFLTVLLFGLKCVWNLFQFIYTTFLGHLLKHNMDLSKCGPWAVVTGSTDGIGKSFAHLLGAAGLNVVLVSRTQAKLEAVAEEIKSANPSIQVKTIAVDFTDGVSIYPTLKTELDMLEIGLLINNVGMSVFAEPLAEIKDNKTVHDLINCNVMSMARMSHLVLPQMVQRRRGVIINIGSLTGVIATPLATLYGATKAFVDKFSRDLAAELKPMGVTIQTVHPGWVVTNMSKLRKSTMTAPDPDTFAKSVFNTLGLESRTSGYWFHKIQFYWLELVRFFAPGIMEQHTLKYMEAHRQKVLKRQRKSQ